MSIGVPNIFVAVNQSPHSLEVVIPEPQRPLTVTGTNHTVFSSFKDNNFELVIGIRLLAVVWR